MTTYDFVMLAILVGAIVLGAWKGLVWQFAPIGAMVLGYVVAYPMSIELAPWFGSRAPANQWTAMLVIYLVVALGVYVAAWMLRRFIEKLKLKEYDRHLGALFGGVKGVLFCLSATFFLVAVSPAAREHILHSRSGYAAAVVMDRLHGVMPEAMHDVLHPYIHALDRPGIPLHSHSEEGATHEHEHVPVSETQEVEAQQEGHEHTQGE